VFNVARFSLHDGPGIRTVIFLKGCPLSCAWCHNPEGMGVAAEVFFRSSDCVACGRCALVCPRAIGQPVAPRPDTSCPLGCQACVAACPSGAREAVGLRRSVAELLAIAEADRAFYDVSGGGVTLSGGEPLAQAEFSTEFLAACGRAGLHRAAETSGFATKETFLAFAEQVDLLLFDVKFMDPDAHKTWVGVDNEPILRNLRIAAAMGKAIRLRRPLIPGVNDSDEEMRSLAGLALELNEIRLLTMAGFPGGNSDKNPGEAGIGVDLLPYHSYAEDKYDKRGKAYQFKGLRPPDDSGIADSAGILSSRAVDVRIGG